MTDYTESLISLTWIVREKPKPFVLPQEDPEHYDITLKSYNIPELSTSELPFDAEDVQDIYYDEEAETFK